MSEDRSLERYALTAVALLAFAGSIVFLAVLYDCADAILGATSVTSSWLLILYFILEAE